MEKALTVLRLEADKVNGYIESDLVRLEKSQDPLLLEVLRYGLLNGGKRVRPLLTVFSARLCGRSDVDLYRLGCAFEYLHAATLFHDDIIDDSDIRRNKKSVFKQFGTTAAILAGDYLHALSMSIVGKLAGGKGLEVFCNATTGMVDGEFMQMRNISRHELSEIEYYEAIMMKTALLIAAACEVGAIYAGATVEKTSALREYGLQLGYAFQMIDDLLDYLGQPNKTGKSVGNDFVEGKLTLPLIYTLANCEASVRDRLTVILSSKESRTSGIEEVTTIIEKTGGFAIARRKAEETVEKALAALDVFSGKQHIEEKQVLVGLARYVLTREK